MTVRWVPIEDVVVEARKTAERAGSTMSLLGTHELVEAVFAAIARRCLAGEKVHVPQFGLFRPASRKARTVRNPATGERMELPELRTLRLQPAKAAKRKGAA